jgi:predicted acyltransferase
MRTRRTPFEKVAAMFVAGAAGIVLGWVWHHWFPINKALWTSSFVVFTAGMALQLLALCYWLVDIKGYKRWATPFTIFGTNALALYFLAEFFARLISIISFARADGTRADLQSLIFDNLFAPWASPECASLMFALCTVLLWLGVMTILYRRRIFIKV